MITANIKAMLGAFLVLAAPPAETLITHSNVSARREATTFVHLADASLRAGPCLGARQGPVCFLPALAAPFDFG